MSFNLYNFVNTNRDYKEFIISKNFYYIHYSSIIRTLKEQTNSITDALKN